MVLLSFKSGMGVGPSPDVSGAGGAANVGNKEFRSIVAAGCNGEMGDGVAVGKNDPSVGTSME